MHLLRLLKMNSTPHQTVSNVHLCTTFIIYDMRYYFILIIQTLGDHSNSNILRKITTVGKTQPMMTY